MNTKRSKRWNGELASLSPEFLKEVMGKMQAYGEQVQFQLPAPGKARSPNYQVINDRGMKMGFDERHLLLRLEADGNVSDNLSVVFTLDAIKQAIAGGGKKPAISRARTSGTTSTRTGGTSRSTTAPAVAVDAVERDKYEYFKNNRDYLPEGISKFSQEISQLMRDGMSAEKAFEQIVGQHF
ncbi:MAG TPA: hypothetical protein VIR76_09585 [Pusillimonas sp.]